ncbi:MAG TPA: adenosylcobinamide-phosphate synthase CbiB [Candidatus Acidoferrales bacterium]|nr:adenosylcobinamide-phosphate synthase CbiB [Candidatus Acidoferrales bacterium]
MTILHMTGVEIAFAGIADIVCGDPQWMPHPVRLFGALTNLGEKASRAVARSDRALLIAGALVASVVTVLAGGGAWLIVRTVTRWSSLAGGIVTVYLAYSTLSLRGLDQGGCEVIGLLERGQLASARSSLAMIVGRDTGHLDEREIIRAVIETVAENSSDGVIAPLLYLAVGGVFAAFAYKAINTMDSMIGYKSERYLYFGRAAARLDDLANFLPSRLTAAFVILASGFLHSRWKKAFRIVLRDARLQPSPNSGYPEAAFAGALSIRLGGANLYGGRKSNKAHLGDPERRLTTDLYPEVRQLLYTTSILALATSVAFGTLLRGFL